MPKVSIIIPTYNSEKTIERAIKSILWQTFKDWEVIIVDDASEDNTVEIVKKYQKLDKRIKLIELKRNTGGPAIPRTIACKEAKGEYIGFLDQDDIYYPEYLELKINYLDQHSEIDILSSLAWAFDEETKKIINVEHGGPVNYVMRKKVIELGGFFRREQNGVDEIGVIYRYFLKEPNGFNKIKGLTSEPITLYSHHPSQGSYVENKDPISFVKRVEALLEEYNEKISREIKDEKFKFFIKETKKVWYSRIGNFYCLANKIKEGRKAFKKSLSFGFNWFSLGFLFLSYLGYRRYRKIEFLLRHNLQRKVFWRLRAEIYKLKYPRSYQKALKILNQFK